MYILNTLTMEFFACFLISIILSVIIIASYPYLKNNENHSIVQKIHSEDVPRFGGLAVIISFFIWGFISNIDEFFLFFYFSFIFIIFALKEDFYSNVSPLIRFSSIFFSSIFFLYFGKFTLPQIEIPIIGEFINSNNFSSLLFFSFAMTAITNGNNLIDGTNGLCASSSIIILLCLTYIGYVNNEFIYIAICCALILSIMGFLFLNYPWQKIFLGDAGAYFIGWTISGLTIIIFGKYPEIPSWIAISVLFYLVFETIFSFARKIIMGKSPFLPDRFHLHIRVFDLFKAALISNGRLANCAVLLFLPLVWSMPLILIYWIYNYHQLIFFAIILQLFLYIVLYYVVSNIAEK